jgi:hypothetical protein
MLYCLQIVFACLLALAASEDKPKAENEDIQVSPADQDVAEWRHFGYFGGHGGYWRGRRSAEETSKREEVAAAVEVSADQEADEMYGRRYYGYYGFPYGSYGHWRGRRSAEEEKIQMASADQDANEWNGRGYYGSYPYGYRSYYGGYGKHW